MQDSAANQFRYTGFRTIGILTSFLYGLTGLGVITIFFDQKVYNFTFQTAEYIFWSNLAFTSIFTPAICAIAIALLVKNKFSTGLLILFLTILINGLFFRTLNSIFAGNVLYVFEMLPGSASIDAFIRIFTNGKIWDNLTDFCWVINDLLFYPSVIFVIIGLALAKKAKALERIV